MNHTKTEIHQEYVDKDVDLLYLFYLLRWHWPILLSVVAVAGAVAIYRNMVTPQTWQGEFEILAKDKTNEGGSINNSLAAFGNLGIFGASQDGLATTIKVLQSKSILYPVFQYYTREFSPKKSLSFHNWDKSILLTQVKGTRVINTTFRSTEKDSIIPVLEKIAQEFQNYSVREASEVTRLGIQYLEKTIPSIVKRSNTAQKEFQLYALRYGIVDSNQAHSSGTSTIPESVMSGVVSNSVTSINTQDSINIQLQRLDRALLERRKYFKENDLIIRNLVSEREALVRYSGSTAGGLISTPQIGMSKDQAQNIMVEYSRLKREAERQTSVLRTYEDQLNQLKLGKTELDRPWEIIAPPYLKDQPVAPRPLRTLFTFLSVGFGIGASAVFLVQQIKGYLITRSMFTETTGLTPLLELDLSKESSIAVLKQFFLKQLGADSKVSFVFASSTKSSLPDAFARCLASSANFSEASLENSNDLDGSHVVVVACAGSAHKVWVKEYLAFTDSPDVNPLGFIWLT